MPLPQVHGAQGAPRCQTLIDSAVVARGLRVLAAMGVIALMPLVSFRDQGSGRAEIAGAPERDQTS